MTVVQGNPRLGARRRNIQSESVHARNGDEMTGLCDITDGGALALQKVRHVYLR